MEEPWSPSTRFHSLGSRARLPASLDTLLSNSLKQNVHTDTASWRRENTKDVHITHVFHTHPCPPLARWSRGEWAASFSSWEMMAEPWACQKIRGPKGMEHVHPPTEPQTESREGQRQGKETPDGPKRKGLYIPGFTSTYQEGWELVYAQGGNKAIRENNKYFLSIYLFFF